MSASLLPEARLVEYLLGELSAEERAQMEECLFNDDALSEELHAAADDPIEAYLAGSLSEGDRARFETHFLASSRRRQRLDFMRALLPAVRRTPPARLQQRWVPWAVAAGLVIAGAAALVAVQLQSRQRAPEVVVASPSPVSSPTARPADQARTEPQEIPVIRLARARASEPVEVPVSENRVSVEGGYQRPLARFRVRGRRRRTRPGQQDVARDQSRARSSAAGTNLLHDDTRSHRQRKQRP